MEYSQDALHGKFSAFELVIEETAAGSYFDMGRRPKERKKWRLHGISPLWDIPRDTPF